ncbi:MAG: PIN domain-containing protein [Actinobacteria bacterium]|nr:PIN domain-containing protein [Actinomycetota bacterium]
MFVDTNVLVYAHDATDDGRRPVAQRLLDELWRADTGALSTQVLQEFYHTVTRKLPVPLTPAAARQSVADYADWQVVAIDPLLILSASHLAEGHSVNFWDALIVEAALRAGATELVTEDLQDGREFGSLRVHNPFKAHPLGY